MENMDFSYKTILITGGTGTFAHAMTLYLLEQYPDVTIRLFSRDEYKQQQMEQYFRNKQLRFFLGDVRDLARLDMACLDVDLVIHAAALKQVPRGEYDPLEFVKTNIYGTENVIVACRAMGVKQAILLSSDKAVHSANLYGNTKAVAEKLWIQSNQYAPHGTRYSVVRYGNIMGARGSVLEVWRAALARGERLRVTDERMTRFWMLPEQAVRLVLWVAAHGLRGGIALPHLPAFRVTDLAHALGAAAQEQWTSTGDVIGPVREALWDVTGIRPGEKLSEVLMTPDEQARAWWYAPEGQTPVHYVVPALVQHWGARDERSLWTVPPMDLAYGRCSEALHAGDDVPYDSATWPWQLDVDELRRRIMEVGDP